MFMSRWLFSSAASSSLYLSQNWREWGPCYGLSLAEGTILHLNNKAVSLSYPSCVHYSSTSNFLQEFFLCIHSLGNCKRPNFQPASPFSMPSSLSSVSSSFWFKVKQVQFFLSLEFLDVIVGLSVGLILTLLCLRQLVEQSEHTLLLLEFTL